MKYLTLLFVMIVMTLLVFSPVMAQEATETPVPDEVVVTEPVETVSNPLDVIIAVLTGIITFITGAGLMFLTRLTDILKQLKEALDIFNVQNAPRQ